MDLLRIGTRCSPLSLQQTLQAESFLRLKSGDSFRHFSLVKITTSGDRILDKPLYEIGGKSLFTKELDLALLDERIDLAVHSAKDIESVLPKGLVIACYLPRGDRRDCLITSSGTAQSSASDDGVADLLRLAKNARLGTASPRRRALVQLLRSDLEITLLRGNIERRLESIFSGTNDAIILASCALERLGYDITKDIRKAIAISKLDEYEFVPAAAQGAIAIVVRESDSRLWRKLQSISDSSCQVEVSAERAFLRQVGGSCHAALGASARLRRNRQDKLLDGGSDTSLELNLCAFVIEDGKKKQLQLKEIGKPSSATISLGQAELLGVRMAKELASPKHEPKHKPNSRTELSQETTIGGRGQSQIKQVLGDEETPQVPFS